jgi:hypothetical protein
MAIQANDVQTLHDYAEGVMSRAGHHAKQVRAIVLAMHGGIIWRVDPGSIEIKQYDGKLANVLWWVSVSGNKYACAYNHHTGEIEIRDRNTQGPALHNFSNTTPITDVERIFSTL